MSFPKYLEYKDSGVEWLGEVPAHWEVSRLGWVSRVDSGHPFPAELFGFDGIPVIRMSDMKDGDVSGNSIKRVPEDSVPERAFAKTGDLLIGLSGSISNHAVIKERDLPCAINQRVGVVRGSEGADFLRYYIQSDSFLEQTASELEETTIQNISMSQVRSCRVAWPSREEINHIATFLDHETARIDALVEEQQCLIELLKEKRQAVISHAVTKGLDPDVPMKGSGVEWLGEVPAHWEVSRLGWVSRVDSGHPFPAELFGFDGIPVIRMSDMKDGDVSDASIKRVPVESVPDRAFAKIGDLLIGLSGSISNHAVIKDCDLPCAINQRVGVIRGSQGADFLRYYIQSTSFLEQTAAELEETTIQNISMGQVRSCKVAWPSRDERNHIATFLDHETARIDALMQEGESVINLLQERRSALISAAVTGKIDVRGWQADQQSEQPEILMAAETRATYG